MNIWRKEGLLFQIRDQFPGLVSHACVPSAIKLSEDVIRIYFAPRNQFGQSVPVFIDVRAVNPSVILAVSNSEVLSLGQVGCFDDGGVMPCSLVRNNDELWMYYVGWNPSVSVPYRNAIGLAISRDGGHKFERHCLGPVVDRNMQEPFFTASPCVLKLKEDFWMMWYASSTGFLTVKGRKEPLYHIKYAESKDGVVWDRKNISCISPKRFDECTARPTVIFEDGIFKMWFTYRGSFDYRDGFDAYRIGFAESTDGQAWVRKDELSGISVSKSGWDSTMVTYPSVLKSGQDTFMFYNGNGFGKTGIGFARLENSPR